MPERDPLKKMRAIGNELFIPFRSGFKLIIDILFLQPDVIAFITQPKQVCNVGILSTEQIQIRFGNAVKNGVFQQLDVFYGRFLGDKAVKGGDKIILETKPMRDFAAFLKIETPQAAFFQKIQSVTDLFVPGEVFTLLSFFCLQSREQLLLRFHTESLDFTNMLNDGIHN